MVTDWSQSSFLGRDHSAKWRPLESLQHIPPSRGEDHFELGPPPVMLRRCTQCRELWCCVGPFLPSSSFSLHFPNSPHFRLPVRSGEAGEAGPGPWTGRQGVGAAAEGARRPNSRCGVTTLAGLGWPARARLVPRGLIAFTHDADGKSHLDDESVVSLPCCSSCPFWRCRRAPG